MMSAMRSLVRNFSFIIWLGKKPGRSAFTRTPCVAHSRARFCDRFFTPAFATEYVNAFESGGPEEAEEMLMMLPFPCFTMCSPKTWQPSIVPVNCTRRMLSHSSTGISKNGVGALRQRR